MTDVLIDLGLDRSSPVIGTPRPGPRARWRRSARLRRWCAVAVVLVLPLAVLPAATPVPPRFVPVFTLPFADNGSFALIGDTLYAVVEGANGYALTAFRLRDGTVRWASDLGIAPSPSSPTEQLAYVWSMDGTLGVTIWTQSRSEPVVSNDPPGRTVAYDPATGRPLWSQDGFIQGTLSQGRVLIYRGRPDSAVAEHVAVDAATGAVVWMFPQPEMVMALDWNPTGEMHWMVTVDQDGLLSLIDLGTGTVVATTTIREQTADGRIDVAGDRLLVWEPQSEVVQVHAYRLSDLAHLWTAPATRAEFASRCGSWICIGGPNGTRALDPDTGEQRWSNREWAYVSGPWPGDLLVVSTIPDGPPRVAFADARTGEIRMRLGTWTMEWVPPKPSTLLITRRPYDGAPAWFALLSPDLSTMTWLGMLDRTKQCQYTDGYLFCTMLGNQLRVWRVNV